MGRTYDLKQVVGDFNDELPAHPVEISMFRMGSTPVTVGMWRQYLRVNSSLSMPEPPEWGWIDSHPMVNVSRNDILGRDGKGGFCAWASRASGMQLLLPTEAQWEFVAKGGLDQKYPWGNEYDDSKVWSSVKRQRSATAPVNRLNNVFVNKFGVSDLSGNVVQLCMDAYQSYVKSYVRFGDVSVTNDPVGIGQVKCLRGGAWNLDDPVIFRCSFRGRYYPGNSFNNFGFRLSAGAK